MSKSQTRDYIVNCHDPTVNIRSFYFFNKKNNILLIKKENYNA